MSSQLSVVERARSKFISESSESKLNSDSSDEQEMILKQYLDVLAPNIFERLVLFSIFSSKYRELTETAGIFCRSQVAGCRLKFNRLFAAGVT